MRIFYFIDKLRDKLGLQFIWPSSSSSSVTAAASNNNTNTNNEETWRAYDSTDRGTCIDWCMSRRYDGNDTMSVVAASTANHQQTADEHINNQLNLTSRLTIYESWFSDHKPLWLEINFSNK